VSAGRKARRFFFAACEKSLLTSTRSAPTHSLNLKKEANENAASCEAAFQMGVGWFRLRHEESANPRPADRPHDPGDAADLSIMG
jgi:hypothetical protein